MQLTEFYAEQHKLPTQKKTIVKKDVRVIPESIFGILVLSYENYFIDDEEDSEVVIVVYSDYFKKIGVIYSTKTEEVTLELVEKTCNYDHTFK